MRAGFPLQQTVVTILAPLLGAAAISAASPLPQETSAPVQQEITAVQPSVPPETAPVPMRSFEAWLVDLRAEALAKGISAATVEQALAGVELLPIVIERDRTQAELTLSLDEYLSRRLTPAMVQTARRTATRHAALLKKVARSYGVAPSIIVAVWGLESNFGRFSGVRPTISALATLAYDQRRADFFRGELFHALAAIDQNDIDLARLKGSWAGAMGQTQFLPSSYREYAQDFDGDGRRDIWGSEADVFASIANYLKGHGWAPGRPWGREVRVSAAAAARIAQDVPPRSAGCEAARQMTDSLPLSKWRTLGVKLSNGNPLPKAAASASLVQAGRRSFLVYENYDALLGYNCAHAYALSAGLLADRIGRR